MNKLKRILNNKVKHLTKIDYLILGIIVLIYSVLSFINLGSFTNPQTFYEFKNNEGVVFEFTDLTDVIRIKLYNGEEAGNYELYVSSDNEEYTYIKDIENEGAFAWKEEKVLDRIKYIKLVAKNTPSILGEVVFYDNSKSMIPVKKVTSTIQKKESTINNLIDEKESVPEKISYLNSTYFDEIYFARAAYDYVYNIEVYEWTHPPLGKLIQAIPIKITNTMAPFYYRVMGNIAGILMIVVMYIFGLALFKTRKYAIFSSLLMFFDCFHFAHTRMGTVDSFLVLFIMLSIYFMYRYLQQKNIKKNLFLSGLFFGLATSVKWTGMLAGLALAILYFTDMIKNKRKPVKLITYGFCFFVFIPLAIYLSCYLFFPMDGTAKTPTINSIIETTENMYNYHSQLEATHSFSSPWYTWPLNYKPVWYYNNKVDHYNRGTIVGIGNIAIWWSGIVSLIYLLYRLIRKKEKEDYLLIISVLSMWLPYIFIGRVMFLYHFFPALPFIMLAITRLFHDLVEKTKKDYILGMYVITIATVFILYYPVISGTITTNNYIEQLKLLSSWYF